MFIYDPTGAPSDAFAADYFTRLAQRVIRIISNVHVAGPGYELDTRLRPSGSHGLLVTSLESFARYHGLATGQSEKEALPRVLSSGAPWERQALLRARCCAGDRVLGAKLLELAHRAAYEQGAPPGSELHHMRMRMERELSHERPGRYDLKTGRGGLLDVEFATQWLQMRYGSDESLRTTDTLEALNSLSAGGYLEHKAYETLHDGYLFLRRLEQRMHVARGGGSAIIDTRMAGLDVLARRVGLHDMVNATAEELLMSRYREVTEEIRAAYLKILGCEG
jgi:glutamate-ammonia-ligase adenylyltransferase